MYDVKELISKEEIEEKVKNIASKIEKDYENEEITLICILKGSTFFTVDLAKNINKNVEIEFIQVSSYGSETISSNIELKLDLKESIEGKNVVIVEDIIDTGRSMKYLLEHLKSKNPRTLKVCALANKAERREVEVPIDYLGFEVPNKYIVGFGFDIDNNYRNLPYVAYLEG